MTELESDLDAIWKKIHDSGIRHGCIELSLKYSSPAYVRQNKGKLLPIPRRCPSSLFKRGERCFLDVGGWFGTQDGIARTDFGLVSGRDALLCSWLNMHNGKRGRKQYDSYCSKNKVKFNQQITNFFDMPKAAILGHFRSTSDFVPLGQLLIFLPDLHLHLFKGTRLDNFIYKPDSSTEGKKSKLISLEPELAELLERAQSLKAKIIQVGDCFEIWEVQAHLIDDYECLDANVHKTFIPDTLKPIWNKMWRERRIMPRNDYQHSMCSPQHYLRKGKPYGLSEPLTEDLVDELSLPVNDNQRAHGEARQIDAIVEGIMAKYPSIFHNDKLKTDNLGMPFHFLRGNHDNMRANFYYQIVEDLNHWIVPSSKYPLKQRGPEAYDIYRGGLNRCIWSEHGHRLDSKNKDEIFDKNLQGYNITKIFTTGRWIGEAGWKQGAIELALKDELEKTFYYMRGDQLLSVYEAFRSDAHVRLVVMGHTHEPVLTDWGIFLRQIYNRWLRP